MAMRGMKSPYLNSLVSRLFSAPAGKRTAWDVVLWWEIRRVAYNAIMAVVGIAAFAAFYLLISASGELKPGDDAVEPLALVAVPIFANVCYTAGWVLEVLTLWTLDRPIVVGPILLKLGLVFSCLVVWVPATLWGVIFLWRLLT